MSVIKRFVTKAYPHSSTKSISKDKSDFVTLSKSEVRDLITSPDTAKEIAKMAQPNQYDFGYLTQHKIIYPSMPNKRIFNTFRDLRTHIFKNIKARNCILMITPLSPGGGGSFIALNIASSIAFNDTKTALLVDCNISHPSLDRLVLTDNNSAGLVDYLRNSKLTPSDIIKPTGIPRLRVITAGHNKDVDTESFSDVRLAELFSELKSRYRDRTIIVDAPCISNHADTTILSELCDYILPVFPYAKTTQQSIAKSLTKFDRTKIIGMVLNNTPPSPYFWKAID
jgi:protein-tyrosine kinase